MVGNDIYLEKIRVTCYFESSNSSRANAPLVQPNTATDMWVFIVKPKSMRYNAPANIAEAAAQGFRTSWNTEFTPDFYDQWTIVKQKHFKFKATTYPVVGMTNANQRFNNDLSPFMHSISYSLNLKRKV